MASEPKAKQVWLRDKAREMRKEPSLAERLLWQELRTCQQVGLRFRRQYVIGPYIVDFACPQARVAVELDGSSHAETMTEDELRTAFLGETDWRVLRFGNFEAIEAPRGTAERVLHVCAARLRAFGVTLPAGASKYLADFK